MILYSSGEEGSKERDHSLLERSGIHERGDQSERVILVEESRGTTVSGMVLRLTLAISPAAIITHEEESGRTVKKLLRGR